MMGVMKKKNKNKRNFLSYRYEDCVCGWGICIM